MADTLKLRQGDALLVVDMQCDFMPTGPLAVPRADVLLPVINRCVRRFVGQGLPVFASRDWHPAAHGSFVSQGGPWPVHCVQGTPGAEFAPGLELPPQAVIVDKGERMDSDGYSAFENSRFVAELRRLAVRRLWVCGVATEYCVRATVLDALRLGFRVVLLRDGIAAVDVQPGDGARAIDEMMRAGAIVCASGVLDDAQ